MTCSVLSIVLQSHNCFYSMNTLVQQKSRLHHRVGFTCVGIYLRGFIQLDCSGSCG